MQMIRSYRVQWEDRMDLDRVPVMVGKGLPGSGTVSSKGAQTCRMGCWRIPGILVPEDRTVIVLEMQIWEATVVAE